MQDVNDRDVLLRQPSRDALVGPWIHFDEDRSCTWNVNSSFSCQASLFKTGLFESADRIGVISFAAPSLQRAGVRVSPL